MNTKSTSAECPAHPDISPRPTRRSPNGFTRRAPGTPPPTPGPRVRSRRRSRRTRARRPPPPPSPGPWPEPRPPSRARGGVDPLSSSRASGRSGGAWAILCPHLKNDAKWSFGAPYNRAGLPCRDRARGEARAGAAGSHGGRVTGPRRRRPERTAAAAEPGRDAGRARRDRGPGRRRGKIAPLPR